MAHSCLVHPADMQARWRSVVSCNVLQKLMPHELSEQTWRADRNSSYRSNSIMQMILNYNGCLGRHAGWQYGSCTCNFLSLSSPEDWCWATTEVAWVKWRKQAHTNSELPDLSWCWLNWHVQQLQMSQSRYEFPWPQCMQHSDSACNTARPGGGPLGGVGFRSDKPIQTLDRKISILLMHTTWKVCFVSMPVACKDIHWLQKAWTSIAHTHNN